MNRTLITSASAVAFTLAALTAIAPTAFATSSNETACLNTAGITGPVGKATVAQIIQLGDCEVAFRNVSLNAGLTRVSQMSKVSAANQAVLTGNLNSTLSALSAVETKLNADTTVSTALTDRGSIANSVRVYLLVLPQTWTVAGADRAQTISASSTALIAELTTRVNALSATSTQTSDLALLADATTQVTNATTAANAAASEVVSLVPDNGNKTTLANNNAAIADAHSKMLTVQADFKTMVQDLKSVIATLH